MSRLQLLILSVEFETTRASTTNQRFKETENKELTQNLKQSQNSGPAAKTSRAKSSHSPHSRRRIKPPSSSGPAAVLGSKNHRHGRFHPSRARTEVWRPRRPSKNGRGDYNLTSLQGSDLSHDIQLGSDWQKCATKSTSPISAATGAADLTQHHSHSSAVDDKSPTWTEKIKAFLFDKKWFDLSVLVGLKALSQWNFGQGQGQQQYASFGSSLDSTANTTTRFSESRELFDKVIEFATDLAVAQFALVKKLLPLTSVTSSRHRRLRHASSFGLPTKSQIIKMLARSFR
ncbi:hypothetical protein V8F33_003783 [Rhypophila sp. PSN 637]